MMNHLRYHLYTASGSKRTLIGLMLLALFWLAATPAMAAMSATAGDVQTIAWGKMGMQLFGGLALFLFGMEQMADALKAVAGDKMKMILARLTTNRFMGAITGAFVTAIIQSSSVTTVLVVGFISAGLMTLSQSIGVIMGANIGTTITAQIVAFKVTELAMLMIAVGFGMLFIAKGEKTKQYGGMLMGLGLVFYGMSVMSDAMKPLRSFQPFLDLMITMENPVVGILVAAAFTGLVQSSSATTGIVIVMASQGFITLPAGIALAFGANIGTCVTAGLAAIGKPREALRAAMVHVLFNVFGVILWFFFIDQLADFVTWFSPSHPELSGAERLGAETPRQIANAHTIFNIANTLIFIGFVGVFAKLVVRLVPDRPQDKMDDAKRIIKTRYINEDLLRTPSMALDMTRLEVGRMGERIKEMMDRIMIDIASHDRQRLKKTAEIDDEVDILHGEIVTYLGHVSRQPLTDPQTTEVLSLMAAVNDLEGIGDIIETDLVQLGEKCIDEKVTISKATQTVLTELHATIAKTVDSAVVAVIQNNQRAARDVIHAKNDVNRLIDAATLHQVQRLTVDEPNRLAAYTIEIDIIEKLKRIYYFSKRMSKSVFKEERESL